MIELLGRWDFFPAGGCVARFTGLRKRPVVRIGVAVGTLGERHSRKPRRAARSRRRVAFCAGHLRVQARERESRLAVIDFCGRLPVDKIVALHAVCAELPAVRIFVTGDAVRRQPQERLSQILHLDQGLYRSLNVNRCMALVAIDSSVFSFQAVTRLIVVEAFE